MKTKNKPRDGFLNGVPNPIMLKRCLEHMAGQTLTPSQAAANTKLQEGMTQQEYVDELITIIENDLLDKGDEKLMDSLWRLKELLPPRVIRYTIEVVKPPVKRIKFEKEARR